MSSGQPPKGKTHSWKGADLRKSAQIQGQTVLLVDRLTNMLIYQQCSIVELNLDRCLNFTSTGRRNILRSLLLRLQENSSIKDLHRSQNGIDAEDLQCIVDGILECHNLGQIDLEEDDPAVYGQHESSLSRLINSRLMIPQAPTQLRKLWISDHLPNRRSLLDDDSTCLDDDDHEICDDEFQASFLRLLMHKSLALCSWRRSELEVDATGDRTTGPQSMYWSLRSTLRSSWKHRERPLSLIPLSLWPILLDRSNISCRSTLQVLQMLYIALWNEEQGCWKDELACCRYWYYDGRRFQLRTRRRTIQIVRLTILALNLDLEEWSKRRKEYSKKSTNIRILSSAKISPAQNKKYRKQSADRSKESQPSPSMHCPKEAIFLCVFVVAVIYKILNPRMFTPWSQQRSWEPRTCQHSGEVHNTRFHSLLQACSWFFPCKLRSSPMVWGKFWCNPLGWPAWGQLVRRLPVITSLKGIKKACQNMDRINTIQ